MIDARMSPEQVKVYTKFFDLIKEGEKIAVEVSKSFKGKNESDVLAAISLLLLNQAGSKKMVKQMCDFIMLTTDILLSDPDDEEADDDIEEDEEEIYDDED